MGIFNLFEKSNNLYFPGCATYFKTPEIFSLYVEIFDYLGIDFKVVDKKICCGLPALELGYENEARKLIRRNFEIFKEEGIGTIITNSPCCYKMFLQNYAEVMPDWNIEVKNVWQIILDKLESKPRFIRNHASGVVTYQDSCYMGRYCGIYDEPRKIIELLGYEISELPDNHENSFCCGSCGGLPFTNPELADKIAKERILQVKRMGVKKMIVASVEDYLLLKKNAEGSGIEIIELSEILAEAFGIEMENKIKTQNEEEVEEIIEESDDKPLEEEI